MDGPLSTSLSRFQISEVFHQNTYIYRDLVNDDDIEDEDGLFPVEISNI